MGWNRYGLGPGPHGQDVQGVVQVQEKGAGLLMADSPSYMRRYVDGCARWV